MMMMMMRGEMRGCEDEEMVGLEGVVTFFVDRVLIFAEAETETSGLRGGRETGCSASHGPVSHLC